MAKQSVFASLTPAQRIVLDRYLWLADHRDELTAEIAKLSNMAKRRQRMLDDAESKLKEIRQTPEWAAMCDHLEAPGRG